MDDVAAFSATYAGLRSLTDGDYRISFDVPGHQIKLALEVLTQGGVPSAAKGTWFAIARLHTGGTKTFCDDSLKSGSHDSISHVTVDTAAGARTRPLPPRSPSSQDGYRLLCMEGSGGWAFMAQYRGQYFVSKYNGPINSPHWAKTVLKDWIGCKESLSEVDDDEKLSGILDSILSLFAGWKRGYDKQSIDV